MTSVTVTRGSDLSYHVDAHAVYDIPEHERGSILQSFATKEWWRMIWLRLCDLLSVLRLVMSREVGLVKPNPLVSLVHKTELQSLGDADGKSYVFDEIEAEATHMLEQSASAGSFRKEVRGRTL